MHLYNLNKNKILIYKYFNSNSAMLYSFIFIICLSIIPYIIHSKTIYYKEFYTAIQFSSSIVAYIAAFTCLMYFMATKEEFYIIIALIYFISASNEFARVVIRILSHKAISSNFLIDYVRTTHILNKVLLSLVLLLACFYSNKLSKISKKRITLLFFVSISIIFTALCGILLIKFFGYTKMLYNLSIFISIFSLFVASSYFIFSTLKKKKDIFSSMLLASFIFIFFGQIYLLFSKTHYDISFVISSISDMIGNAMPILGISIQFVSEIKKVNLRIEQCNKLQGKLNKFYRVVEESPNMIAFLDEKGKFQYMNPSFKSTLINKNQNYIGKSVSEVYDSSKIDVHHANIKNNLKNSNAWSGRVSIPLNENESLVYKCSVFKLISEKLKENNYVIISEDVSESSKIEEKLKKSEKKLREITDNMIDIICKVDRDGVIEYISSSYCNLSKRNYKEFRSKHVYEIIHPEDLNLVEEVYSRVKNSGISESVEYRLKIFNNEYIWVESIVGVLLDDAGEINGAIISSRDITDKRKLVETMEYDRIKTEFFANISHELRTPINVIFSALQVVEMYSFSHKTSSDISKYNKIMKQNCYRLLRLVNNLIDITKIDSGYLKLQLGNHDIIKIVEDITMSVVDYAENKGISIIFDTDIEEKVIACDPDKIERIVMNLLSNSVKFTPEKGRIYVSIYNGEKDRLYISVKDSGRGIPKEKLDIIFERFRQVDKSLARDHEGSGIGLSLVKSLVELHGGRIKVESEVGLGSDFRIELPCRYIEDDNVLYDINEIKQSHIERINIEFSDIYGINY